MSAFCRDCFSDAAPTTRRCKHCGGHRILAHDELDTLSIAHLDCDAFYAAIEKRDDPSLRDKPVIVGGRSRRGVVSTCCYIARINGVRSAMPMFKALELCPQAVCIPPDFTKYTKAARQIRAMMQDLTPLVEPLSLDEAYMDLTGTHRLHGHSPAQSLARLARQIEAEVGITVSIGLSHNKFLAKLASEIDKPRGFAVIGVAEALSFLRDKPVSYIRGAGNVLQARLIKDGITHIGQLQYMSEFVLAKRYGNTGLWLIRRADARDTRDVVAYGDMKSFSSETTFETNISDYKELEAVLWRHAERVSARAKSSGLGGRTIVLKLKTANFKIRTRSVSLDAPTQLADKIFRTAREALRREASGTAYRLLGVGISQLADEADCDPVGLVDDGAAKRAAAERAIDRVRARFGGEALGKGRGRRGVAARGSR